jgi:hypothetical protein
VKKFPTTIFVTVDGDEGDTYLLVNETQESINHGQKVAVYELAGVQTMHVTRELVDQKQKGGK